jgi:starvation-inducible DNA-binding protein
VFNPIAETAQLKEFVCPLSQADYVRALIAANEKLVAAATQAQGLAGEANAPESQDLMIGRITLHQKTIWMLKSFVKTDVCPWFLWRPATDSRATYERRASSR